MAPVSPPDAPSRSRRAVREAGAGVGALLLCVLAAAPAGLLWAALAPTVRARVVDGAARVADPTSQAYIATDGAYLLVTAVAGLLTGLAAHLLLGRRHSLGVVLGLFVGGLLAAEITRRAGFLVGLEDVRAFVAAGQDGVVALTPRLRAAPALVTWAVVAMLVHLVATAGSRPR